MILDTLLRMILSSVPPPYERLVWGYTKAEFNNIRKSLSHINWENALKDLNVNGQVEYLTSCIFNVFSNFVPNTIITCRDKDPPWITEEVKKICHKKAKCAFMEKKKGKFSAFCKRETEKKYECVWKRYIFLFDFLHNL